MYQPAAFVEDRLEVMHGLMRDHPLATLVTGGALGLMANLIHFQIHPELSPQGTLRAHLARANGQLAALAEGGEAMVVFQGPQAYVSPSLYASKREHGRVVPTWNYVTVHAWGVPRLMDDAVWMRRQVGALTDRHEAGRADPWAVEDAPADFVAAQMRGIVGLEIDITRIEGKWKASQNRQHADRAGVAAGLGGEMGEVVKKGLLF